MTRGYTRREAVRMIVAGFFQQVFDRITIESVRDALGEAIGRRVSDIKELAARCDACIARPIHHFRREIATSKIC